MENIVLNEAESTAIVKKVNKKKYKCPYCEARIERAKLHIHIQNEHEDMIPEGYTALRVAFNSVNNKTEGHCIICKKVTAWNEDKGRYERLCDSPACKEAYKKIVAERNQRVYGTDRLQNDPRYAEYVQRKALEGRKMFGKYKFADGGEISYVGTYEKKFLQFMDTVMHCESEDIIAPGPAIKYSFEGKEHLYIPDFYYIPYNLIIEIKDGGENPNNHPKRLGVDEQRLKAKEAGVIKADKFNYVRVVNNDFGQLLSIMAVLKFQMMNNPYFNEHIIKVNESTDLLNESILFNQKDIYYNKDKFDSGEINLCFITGLSGSGKSTMGRDMQKSGVEHYELDDLMCISDHFTMDQLKEYGDLIYSFFNGIGKRFYPIKKANLKDIPGEEYEDKLYPAFVNYAKSYAKSHKSKKFVIEGVHLFGRGRNGNALFDPSDFDDYAFYIKGTSMIISKIRAAKRDAQDSEHKNITAIRHFMTHNWKWYFIDEKDIKKFRDYFSKKVKSMNEVTEDMSGTIAAALPLTPNPIPYESDKSNYYIVQHPKNNVFAYGITKDPQRTIYAINPEKDGSYKVYQTDKGKIDKKYLTFKIKDSQSAKELYDELALLAKSGKSFYNETVIEAPDYSFIYRYLTGSKEGVPSPDELFFDSRFELVKNSGEVFKEQCDNLYKWLKARPIDILEEQVTLLEDYYTDGLNDYNVLPDNIDNLEDLKAWKNKYDAMPYEYRMRSDDISMDLYRDTNTARYTRKMAVLLDMIDPNTNEPIENLNKNTVMVSDFFEESDNGNTVFRYTYNGHGIYDSLKNAVSFDIWKSLKNSGVFDWLPVPDVYEKDGNYKSYFTLMGKEKFENTVLPIVYKYMDKKYVELAKFRYPHEKSIVYKDSYQIVVKGDIKLEPINESTLESKQNASLRGIVNAIHAKYEKDKKDPVGNQNCQLCTWCAEAQMRGINILPRPVYSPRDKVFDYDGLKIIKNPSRKKVSSIDDIIDIVSYNKNSRYYAHVKWSKNSSGGHEFIVANIDDSVFVADPQAGLVSPIESSSGKKYFSGIDFDASFIARMDDHNINNEVLELNDDKYILEWDKQKDIPYMLKHNMISKEEARKELNESAIENDVLYSEWELKMQKVRDAETQGLIIMIDPENGFIEDYTEDSIAALKAKWEKYQSLPYEKRILSSETAYNILGMSNENLYTRILNIYLTKLDAEKQASNYHPSEDSYPAEIYSQAKIIESLCLDYKHEKDLEKKESLREQISDLGWNPEVPFSKEYYEKTYVKYECFSNIVEIDATNILEAQEAIEDIPKERTSENLKDKIVPIFVVLCHGVQLHSKGIMWFTDSEWSHVSLALDSSLNEMYTFTTNIDNAPNKNHKTGFAVDTKERYMKLDPHMKVKVYALFITPEQKVAIQEAINWYIKNQDKTSYAFKNIFNIFRRKPTKRATEEEDKCKMVCSQFVYTILKLVNFKLRKVKDSSLISPADIDELSDDARFYVVYEGGIDKYKKEKIDKICYKLLPTLPIEMYNLDESSGVQKVKVKSAIGKVNQINRIFEMAKELMK